MEALVRWPNHRGGPLGPDLFVPMAEETGHIQALTEWVQKDFELRLENPAQQFGIEQMMRFLGSSSVRGLPLLITESSTKIDRICGLVADLGDDATKLAAHPDVDLHEALELVQNGCPPRIAARILL